MNDLIQKISEYKLFNYVLPGVVFSVIVTELSLYGLVQIDLFAGFFLYYFIGLSISRIGSLVVEPILLKTHFVKFSPYKDFLKAVKKDSKIDTLMEAANTFRTLATTFIVIAVVYGVERWPTGINTINKSYVKILVLLLSLSVLFLVSYKKQISYITKRISK